MRSGLSSRWWWGGLAGLLLLLSAQVAAAQPRSAREGSREAGRDPDREQEAPGVFDYYLMSFTIAPSFCAQSARYAEKRECQDGTDAAYRETPLTVHGLWPNRERVSVNLQPQYCAAEPLAGVSAPVAKALRRYMPGTADGLDRYEWRRHGACSGLSADAYFGAVVRLAERANATIGAALREGGMLGREVRIDELLTAIAAKDPAVAPAVVVSCRFPQGQVEAEARANIVEIRLVLSKDFTPQPVEQVGFRHNSGCPHGAGFLPGGFKGE